MDFPFASASAYTTSWPAEPGMSTTMSVAETMSLRGHAACRPGCWICTAHLRPVAVHRLGELGEARDERVLIHREAGDGRAARLSYRESTRRR